LAVLDDFPSTIALTREPAVTAAFAADSHTADGARPIAVAKPTNVAQIEQLLHWANKQRAALIPVSSATGPRRRGDTTSKTPAIIVDLSSQRRVIHIDSENRIALIEPGVTFPDLDQALRPQGLRAFKPLLPRSGKSVLASHLEREPITSPYDHWDTADPLSAIELVFGNGERFRTGGAAAPGPLEDNLKRGLRQMVSGGPMATDFTRVLQGAQGSLGVVCWGSVYSERLPALEHSYFVPSDDLAPLVELAYKVCWRRIPGQLFIVDRTQLALMTCTNRASFEALTQRLPRWLLFVNLAVSSYFPDEQMAYLDADLHADAQRLSLQAMASVADVSAAKLHALLHSPVEGDYKARALGHYADFFFLSQLDKAQRFVNAVAQLQQTNGSAMPAAFYLQPNVHGVGCHVEVTLPHTSEERQSASALRSASVEACMQQGAFFSRPYAPWGEVAFRADPAAAATIAKIKQLLDPNGVMNPDRFTF
jgi:hypothetical protein